MVYGIRIVYAIWYTDCIWFNCIITFIYLALEPVQLSQMSDDSIGISFIPSADFQFNVPIEMTTSKRSFNMVHCADMMSFSFQAADMLTHCLYNDGTNNVILKKT